MTMDEVAYEIQKQVDSARESLVQGLSSELTPDLLSRFDIPGQLPDRGPLLARLRAYIVERAKGELTKQDLHGVAKNMLNRIVNSDRFFEEVVRQSRIES